MAEGAACRLQVARPLAKWLEQEEQKAQAFAVNLQPLLTRFLPHGSAIASSAASRSSSMTAPGAAAAAAGGGSGQLTTAAAAGAGGEAAASRIGGVSLAAAQQELFGPVHAFAAEQVRP